MRITGISGGKRAHMHPVLSKLVDDEILDGCRMQTARLVSDFDKCLGWSAQV